MHKTSKCGHMLQWSLLWQSPNPTTHWVPDVHIDQELCWKFAYFISDSHKNLIVLTRKLRHRESRWLVQCHKAANSETGRSASPARFQGTLPLAKITKHSPRSPHQNQHTCVQSQKQKLRETPKTVAHKPGITKDMQSPTPEELVSKTICSNSKTIHSLPPFRAIFQLTFYNKGKNSSI